MWRQTLILVAVLPAVLLAYPRDSPIWPESCKAGWTCTRREDCHSGADKSCGNQKVCCPQQGRMNSPLSIHERMCAEHVKLVKIKLPNPVSDDEIEINNCVNDYSPLIINGVNAEPQEFPFMALIGYGNGPQVTWACGGSLISPWFVLSAAHCTFDKTLGLAKWVRLGDLDINRSDDLSCPRTLRIAERHDHPEYKPPLKYHDISIYKLKEKVIFNSFVRPLCLLDLPDNEMPKVATIVGWGKTENGTPSTHLKKASVDLRDESECNTQYPRSRRQWPAGIAYDRMICAGGKRKEDTCNGDSGGPLLAWVSSKYYCMYSVIGITSFGSKECGTISTVYTRVSYYLKWIEEIVWPSPYYYTNQTLPADC